MTTVKRTTGSDKKSSSIRKAVIKLEKTKGVITSTHEPGTHWEMPKIDYTFENGMTINGTIEQIEKVAASMKLKVNYKSIGHRPAGYYHSTTKGLIKISGMNDYHLRRALLREAKEYYSNMYSATDSSKEFLTKFVEMSADQLIVELFTELSNR